jgi:hypothetical protein
MSRWFSKCLGNGVNAFKPQSEIQEQFMVTFLALGQPKGMAVFSKYDLEKNIVTVYFSPATNELALQFGAKECEKPSLINLGLLVGDQSAFNIYFSVHD